MRKNSKKWQTSKKKSQTSKISVKKWQTIEKNVINLRKKIRQISEKNDELVIKVTRSNKLVEKKSQTS